MSKATRTPELRRQEMEFQRGERMANVNALVRDLHDNDFRALLIESHQIDDHFYQRVIIERGELSPNEITTLQAVSDVHDATMQLIQLRLDQVEHSRIAIWPSRD